MSSASQQLRKIIREAFESVGKEPDLEADMDEIRTDTKRNLGRELDDVKTLNKFVGLTSILLSEVGDDLDLFFDRMERISQNCKTVADLLDDEPQLQSDLEYTISALHKTKADIVKKQIGFMKDAMKDLQELMTDIENYFKQQTSME